jgi:STE24 endopeptidase
VNHELGHVVHNHIVWNMVSSVIQVTIMFSVFKLCLGNEDILSSFGFSKPSNFVYLFLFSILYGPTNCMTKFIVMFMIRTMEYQADDFATYHGHAQQLKSGLTKIFVKSKGPLTADPLYSAYNHSHPTLMERLLNIDAKAKK